MSTTILPSTPLRWSGTARAAIASASPDQAWSLLCNFCSLHRWVPSVQSCYILHGTEGVPGCVRYCAGPVNRSGNGRETGWSKERLTAFDEAGRSYSYEMVESNKGFGRYVACMRVVPCSAADVRGCVLEWSFEADPVVGYTQEGFLEYLSFLAAAVAMNISEALKD